MQHLKQSPSLMYIMYEIGMWSSPRINPRTPFIQLQHTAIHPFSTNTYPYQQFIGRLPHRDAPYGQWRVTN